MPCLRRADCGIDIIDNGLAMNSSGLNSKINKMQYKKDIEKALKEMETRKKSYMLDMAQYNTPGSCVYDTELIRKLEVTDATIHTLRWVLQPKQKSE